MEVVLGARIDPTGAQKGAKEAASAADLLARAFERAYKKQQDGARQTEQTSTSAWRRMVDAARTAAAGIGSAFSQITNAIGMFSPQLGFALQGMQGLARGAMTATSSLANLARGASGAGGALKAFAAGGTAVIATVGAITVAVGGLLAVLLPLAVAWKTTTAAFSLFSSGVSLAATFETYENRFASLLGSMEAARTRMKDIARIAEETPFDLDNLTRASLTLEALTRGAYSSETALKRVGDAAARSGMGIEEVADNVGRLYNALKVGVNYDDPLRTLMGRGIIDPTLYPTIMSMVKAGKDFAEIWQLVTDQLDKTEGAMFVLSTTFSGKVERMKDAWDAFKRTLGAAILPSAKTLVDAISASLENLQGIAQKLAPDIQRVADNVVAALLVMTEPGGLDAALTAAGNAFIDIINTGFSGWTAAVDGWVKDKFGVSITEIFQGVMEWNFWSKLETDIFPRLGTALMNAFADAISDAFKAASEMAKAHVKSWFSVLSPSQIVWGEMLGNQPQAGPVKSGSTTVPRTSYTTIPAKKQSSPVVYGQPDSGDLPSWNDAPPFGPDDISSSLLPDIVQMTDSLKASSDSLQQIAESIPFVGPPEPIRDGNGASVDPEQLDFAGRLERKLNEIQRTRDEDAKQKNIIIGKNPLDVGGVAAAAAVEAASQKEKNQLESWAKSYTEKARLSDPAVAFRENLSKLDQALEQNLITKEQWSAGHEKAKEDYLKAVESMRQAEERRTEEAMGHTERLINQWGKLKEQVDIAAASITEAISDSMVDGLSDWIDGTKSASEAFGDMAKNIISHITKIILQLLIQYAISSALGMTTGAITVPSIPKATQVAHDGGVAGDPGTTRAVSPTVFSNAAKYHTGGQVGLAPGEVPIVAERGEVVLTQEQQAATRERLRGEKSEDAGKKQEVTILNVTDGRMIEEFIAKNPNIIVNAIHSRLPQIKRMIQA